MIFSEAFPITIKGKPAQVRDVEPTKDGILSALRRFASYADNG